MVTITDDTAAEGAEPAAMARWATAIRRNPTIAAGAALLAVLVSLAILAPWLTADPLKQATINRLRPPCRSGGRPTRHQAEDHSDQTRHKQQKKNAAPVDPIDDQAAERRADEKPELMRHRHQPLRPPFGAMRHRAKRQGSAGGLNHRTADTLYEAKGDQLQDVLRNSA